MDVIDHHRQILRFVLLLHRHFLILFIFYERMLWARADELQLHYLCSPFHSML
jgi:hypothetical protein